MIRRYVILRRKPGVTVEQFRAHWKNFHAPLVLKVPGIIKYFQHHVRDEYPDAYDDPIDGIAEIWFESKDAMQRAYQTPEYKALLVDAQNILEENGHHIHPLISEESIEFK